MLFGLCAVSVMTMLPVLVLVRVLTSVWGLHVRLRQRLLPLVGEAHSDDDGGGDDDDNATSVRASRAPLTRTSSACGVLVHMVNSNCQPMDSPAAYEHGTTRKHGPSSAVASRSGPRDCKRRFENNRGAFTLRSCC